MRARLAAPLALVLAAGCAAALDADRALVDARRAELVLTHDVARTLREVSAVASSANALVEETRPRVAAVLEDAKATSGELRSRAWLLWASCAALFGALLAAILRRSPRA